MTPLSTLLPFRVERPGARLRLFCLPFAGGGAATYRTWSNALAPSIEVCAIELPGRGTRFREAPLRAMTALVDGLSEGLAPLLREPYALFGHSMGARVALELGRRHPERLVHFFASAALPPHREVAGQRPLANVRDEELIDELRRWGGTPEEVLSNAELLEIALPILRADIAIIERAGNATEPRVACPVTVLAGTDDPDISLDEAAAWSACTSASSRVVPVEAGHFFVVDAHGRQAVLDVVAATLAGM